MERVEMGGKDLVCVVTLYYFVLWIKKNDVLFYHFAMASIYIQQINHILRI